MQILSFALWQGRSLRVMRVVLWEDGGLSISAMPRLATEAFGGCNRLLWRTGPERASGQVAS